MKTFAELGLSKQVLNSLNDLGFKEPTDIQEKTIPLALAGKDIIGGSATGSGKTLAFASPILENTKSNNLIQALILTPTRELAEQVSKAIEHFSQNKKLKVLPIYGGVSINTQIKKLLETNIVIGTPGRILDHMRRGTLRLNHVKILVLDEVDRMFDMGFHKDVETIIKECPKKRQTMLFSATISSEIDHLAEKHTNNAIEISVESYVDPKKLKQIYYDVPSNLKFSLLVHLLKEESSDLVMVFCNTRRNVDFITRNLKNSNIHALAIHGGLPQNKRIKAMEEFNKKRVGVLVCTDVAARGLDIKGVSHVYNYDLPAGSHDYIHRIGRTARAGEQGKAINILSQRDYNNFRSISRDDSLKITRIELPKIDLIKTKSDFRTNDKRSFNRRRPIRGKPLRRFDKRNFSSNKFRTNDKRSFNRRRPIRGKPLRRFDKRNFSSNKFRTNDKRSFGRKKHTRKRSMRRR